MEIHGNNVVTRADKYFPRFSVGYAALTLKPVPYL